MVIILCYIMLSFLAIVFAVTLFNAITAPMLNNGSQPKENCPFVSVLIPARNESKNILGCLQSLCKQDYPQFEILILDDQSTDNTAEIVKTIALTDRRIKYIYGKELPKGWTGKNWACYQASQYANGDVFIFTDADNRHSVDAISKTVGWMQKLNLDLFSTFPQQYTFSLGEKLVVPSVYMTVYCYLPLWLTYYLPFPSLAAANGQWISFTKQAYRKLGGHEAAKSEIVEDTYLARFAKQQNMKTLTTAGTEAVSGRMYNNWSEVWHGFSKNLFGLMSYQTIPFLFLLLMMFVGYVCPYILIFKDSLTEYAGIALILNLIIRSILTWKYKDPFINIILHPLAILLTIIIGINSIYVYKRGNLEWKDRKIFSITQ